MSERQQSAKAVTQFLRETREVQSPVELKKLYTASLEGI